VITELTLRLQGIPEAISSARCAFPSVDAACQAVMTTIQYGIPVARIELLDEESVKAANAYSQLDLPVTPLLLLEFHGSDAGVVEQAETFGSIAEEFGGFGFEATTTAEERNKLWAARHNMYWACMQIRPGAKGISTDVCVPISRLADCVGQTREKAAEMGLIAPIVGHVGDGNFHCLVLVDMENEQERTNADAFISWLNDLAISMDGTCTGEHGIGQGKRPYLQKELGEATRFMGAIKAALDPQNIMNPGKIVAD
jgi:D-lactate dehydrogenase (cytochrome)